MTNIDEKIALLKKSGKIDKIRIYSELIKDAFKEKPEYLYQYFEEMHELVKDFLKFDPNLNEDIKIQLGMALKYLFLRIRNISDIQAFDRFKPVYDSLKVLISDKEVIANILQAYGYVYWLKNEHELALKYLNESLNIINQTDSLDIPQRYTNVGYIYEFKGDYIKAEEYYNEALEFAKRHNSDIALEYAYAALGRLSHCTGKYDLAIKYYESSLSLSDSTKPTINHIIIKSNIAMNYYRTNRTDKALNLLFQIKLDWVRKLNPELYYSILANIGACYTSFDNFVESRKYDIQVLEYAEKSQIIPLLMSSYSSVGYCDWKLKNYDDAIKRLNKALEYAEKDNNLKKKMLILQTLGEVYIDLDKLDLAMKILIKADKLAKKSADFLVQERLKHKIAYCHEKKGNYKLAHATLLEEINILKQAKADKSRLDKETEERQLVSSGQKTHYIYTGGMSLLSNEINGAIGLPIIGTSKSIQDIIEKAFIASKNHANVLILGESGTGKESIARLIHHASIRSNNDFVEINSAVFTTSLAESSLFGHKKGSFTGATDNHKGLIEKSDHGTLFFDEIGEMPIEIQSMLLRVLETKEITPLGDTAKKSVDFRLICATNINVAELAEKEKFRFDLYHRINTIEINLPPLRERKSDIPLLVKYYLQHFSKEMNAKVPSITQEALTKLYNYNYPGNIRELKNIVQRLILFCKNEQIESDDVFLTNSVNSSLDKSEENLDLEDIEKQYICIAMARSKNVITKAAKLLGISSYALSRRIKKYELSF